MAHTFSFTHAWHETGRILEHMAAVVIGFVMMVIGLGLSVTMVMLPVGLVIGLLGFALFVGGLFAHMDDRT